MYFYEVLVAEKTFKGSAALTYQYAEKLPPYTIVSVPLKDKTVVGVVSAEAKKPKFTTKPLELAHTLPTIPPEVMQLRGWLQQYYPAGSGEITQLILPAKLPKKLPEVAPVQMYAKKAMPNATAEQRQILQQFIKPGTYVLHGETGTGKTRVYLELAKRELEKGRSSIVLTPEIGLTPQLAQTFEEAFGTDRVILLHSQLTEKQRLANWLRILHSEKPLIVIGPRSALFAPVKSVGLIVLDEAHENSYKQEQAPHYHASKVAATLANLHRATLVLGSATPLVTDYFLAQGKEKPILRMTQPARRSEFGEPVKIVVDLKDRNHFTRQPHLSNELLTAIEQSLHRGEQSLVFLNRRGTARVVLCQHCGWQATCPHCDLPFTYHGDNHTMRCHTCGTVQPALTSCPNCKSTEILMKSIGTKAIVEEVQKSFPGARIQRFDTDNKKAERLETHYKSVSTGAVDIIIGTQIVAKGLDLPKLSTVGVVTADTSLYLPDYTAQERSYQLLRQVIGRVGRGHRNGTVVVQTYDPSSRLIQDALNGSWGDFYHNELAERKKYLFPPFCYTLKLTCRRASAASAQAAAEKFTRTLRETHLPILVDGPMPSYHEKIAGKYQWQLIVKAKDRTRLLQVIAQLPANWNYDIDPLNLL